MKQINLVGITAMTVVMGTLIGCAFPSAHFDRILPGMTSAEVRKVMDKGPTHFESIANTDFSTWSFGEDSCVLFKNDRVVAKDTAHDGASATNASGVGYQEHTRAQCLAPGQSATGVTERSIHIPGIGTVHLPSASGSAKSPSS